MGYYVKVTKEVAQKVIKLPLTRTADGNALLWQSELKNVEGLNLREKAATLGGTLIPAGDANKEINGTVQTPAKCYTPTAFGGDGDTSEDDSEDKAEESTESKEEVSNE